MRTDYIAHRSDHGDTQSVAQHCQQTAAIAKDFSVEKLKSLNYLCGMLHDIGKYSDDFQKRISGDTIMVEHAICGAKEVPKFQGENNPLTLLLQLCIAGHHTGLPDCGNRNDTEYEKTLYGRLKRKTADYSAYIRELEITPILSDDFMSLLQKDCKTNADVIEKFAFLVRYCFSCLTDADSLDTISFCKGKLPDPLRCNFEKCLRDVDKKLSGFQAKTELQKARQKLQKQAFGKNTADANIYLMNMPTGSGKTLASMRWALQRIQASKGRLKRIIYVIPYNSIIDQTAEIFEDLFQEHTDIIRHQSSFDYTELTEKSEDFRISAESACENWDAGVVITTAVQFFESLYGSKRRTLRKVHNMANSIIVFDESHLMPKEYLEPCLRGITYITKYLNSEALFLTATMPDFRMLLEQCAESNLNTVDLIEDKTDFEKFRKCRFTDLGQIPDSAVIQKASEYAASLIVVNSRKQASELYRQLSGERYHLSTCMASVDRARVIGEIKNSLKALYEDFPDLTAIPQERKITVVSTSLIEAGVDLDFTAVFRELTGLDSILQAGGRCNREGQRPMGDVFIFEFVGSFTRKTEQELTKGILSEFEDISGDAAIKAYYNRLFFDKRQEIHAKSISLDCAKINLIPFRTYSENFKIVDDRKTISVAVCRDENSSQLYETLRRTGYINSRKIQKFCCTLYLWEFEQLRKLKAVDDFGSGIFFLTDLNHYDDALGIQPESKDFII